MEDMHESHEPNHLTLIAARFMTGLRIVGRTMSTADLNPHEGRLRASLMPAEYMDIPDFLPSSDQNL
jgi:hypothetical protein